jgi:hypothetical protein
MVWRYQRTGSTMAAVVRGLVERFLDDQASKP